MALQLKTSLLPLLSRRFLRAQTHQAIGLFYGCQHLMSTTISYDQTVQKQQKCSNHNFLQSRNFHSFFKKKKKTPEKIRESDNVESHYDVVYSASSVSYILLGLGGVQTMAGLACITLGYGALGFPLKNIFVFAEQPLEVATFITINFMICFGILRLCTWYPLRIYYSEVEDKFLIVFVGVHPFAVRHMKVSPGEVKPNPPGRIATIMIPWAHQLFSTPTQTIQLNAEQFSGGPSVAAASMFASEEDSTVPRTVPKAAERTSRPRAKLNHGLTRKRRRSSSRTSPRPGSIISNEVLQDHESPLSENEGVPAQARTIGPPVQDSAVSLNLVMDAIHNLQEEVKQLKPQRQTSTPRLSQVNVGAHDGSAGSFSGFQGSSSDDDIVEEHVKGESVLIQSALALGPPESVSMAIEQQVAEMVNFLFNNGMRENDYKAICEDDVVKRPDNCTALAPVECNPQVLDALKTEAKKNYFRLKEVNKDILRAATIITKSLVKLDKVAQTEGHSLVALEVGMINGALALLGNANHRNNLVRRLIMKKEINSKYAHLCSNKVKMTRFLFGDDVSQATRQIEDSERLKNKFSPRKTASTWRFTGGRFRGWWSKPSKQGFSSRFQPYTMQRYGGRGSQRHPYTRIDTASKNARSRGGRSRLPQQ